MFVELWHSVINMIDPAHFLQFCKRSVDDETIALPPPLKKL